MSAGAYTPSKYEADSGNIYSIRVQPETISATIGGTANAAPAGAIDQEVSAKVSKGNRGYGVKPRTVTFRWTGAVPDGYSTTGLVTLPILTPTVYGGIVKGEAVNYLGSTGSVVSKSPERVG
jgi:hypothetical protein